MGFTCTHLWRWEYPTRRYYHPYQVPNWFRVSVWLFSHSTTIHVNCGLILHNYECTEMTLDETRPSMLRENEWEYLLPHLESNGLLGVLLNVFWRESSLSPHIIGVLTKIVLSISSPITMFTWCTKWWMMKCLSNCPICSSMMTHVWKVCMSNPMNVINQSK